MKRHLQRQKGTVEFQGIKGISTAGVKSGHKLWWGVAPARPHKSCGMVRLGEAALGDKPPILADSFLIHVKCDMG